MEEVFIQFLTLRGIMLLLIRLRLISQVSTSILIFRKMEVCLLLLEIMETLLMSTILRQNLRLRR